MARAALVHRGALDPLVERADEKRQGASARLSAAPDVLSVHFTARQEVIDRPHPVPHTIVGQVLPHEQQQLPRQRMLPGHRTADLVHPGQRIPELPALTLADGIVCQHHEATLNQT